VRAEGRTTDSRLFDRSGNWTRIRTERVEGFVGLQLRAPGGGDVMQVGVGEGRVWSRGLTRDAPMAALRLDTPGRYPRQVDAVLFGGDRGYGAVRGALAAEFTRPWGTIRPGVRGGWASLDAPLDEWMPLGGPATVAGMREDEWLGSRAVAGELRLVRHAAGGLDMHVMGQVGYVEHAISRTDLDGRMRVAGGLGLIANIPFGPIRVDLGISEGGARRLHFAFGQDF
jgi:hypothetical protein